MRRRGDEHSSVTGPQTEKNIRAFGRFHRVHKRLAKNHGSVPAALNHLIHEKMIEAKKQKISARIR